MSKIWLLTRGGFLAPPGRKISPIIRNYSLKSSDYAPITLQYLKKNRACGGLFMITILLFMYTHKLLRLHSKKFAPAAGFSGSLSYYSCKRTNYCDYNIITLVILGPDTCNLTNYADYPNFPAITQIIQPNTHEILKSLEIWLPLNKGGGVSA